MKALKTKIAAALIALATGACVSMVGGQCARDPVTGTVTCQGEYQPAPPPVAPKPQGERG